MKKSEIALTILFLGLLMCVIYTLFAVDTIGGDWYQKNMHFDKITENYTGQGTKIAIVDSGVSDQSMVDELVTINSKGENFEHGDINSHLLKQLAPDAHVTMYDVVNEDDMVNDTDYVSALEMISSKQYDIVVLPLGGHKNITKAKMILNKMSDNETILIGAVGDYAEEEILYPAKYDNVIPICASTFYGTDYDYNNGNPSECYYFPGTDIKYNGQSYSGSSYATAIAAAYIADYLQYQPDTNQKDIVDMLEFIKGENNTGYHYIFDIDDSGNFIFENIYNNIIIVIILYLTYNLKKYKQKYGKL